MNEHRLESLPGGMTILSGGSRRGVRLDRPWQVDIATDAGECLFETRQQDEVARVDRAGGWRVIRNLYTPFSFHQLVLPFSCWPVADVRVLGGRAQLSVALEIIENLCAARDGEFWIGVHVGPYAGQNIAHVHYHVLTPISSTDGGLMGNEPTTWESTSENTIRMMDGVEILASGHRAGQCVLRPARVQGHGIVSIQQLAGPLDWLVRRAGDRFCSKQGLAPDYMIGISALGATVAYAFYLPILNHWGFTEYFALLERRPIVLPWTHADTAAHLRDDR